MQDQTLLTRAMVWGVGVGAFLPVMVGAARVASGQASTEAVTVQTSQTTGLASFVTPAAEDSIPVPLSAGRVRPTPMDFVAAYGHLFGVTAAEEQLVVARTATDELGYMHTTFHQVHHGIPVFGGVLKVHQNAAGGLTAANGDFYPISEKLPLEPAIDTATARDKAAATTSTSALDVERSDLVIVDPGWYGDMPRGEHLAYHVILTDRSAGLREAFFVDAHTGEILDRWSMIQRDKYRSIHGGMSTSNCCQAHHELGCDNLACQEEVCGLTPRCCEIEWNADCVWLAGIRCGNLCSTPGAMVRNEGDPPTGNAEVDTAYDYCGDMYDYYARAFGRDSIDDLGMTILAWVNITDDNFCPNASWDGLRINHCTGTVTDDIVGHELTHGVTEFSANLIYQNQPGQLNESFSDIFAELIDLFNGNVAFPGDPSGPAWPTDGGYVSAGLDTPNNLRTRCSYSPSHIDGVRWLLGEDSTAFNGAIRDMWDPPCYGDPSHAYHSLQICDPSDNGGVHSGSGIPNHAFAMMTDGKVFNGYTVNGIGPIKSAAVWYRALTVYLTMASDFEDAYFCLNQAAQDLIGTTPIDPRTGAPSASVFTADDAAEVDKALLAVEMNTEGACGAVTPILNSDPPDQCLPRLPVYSTDFEDGAPGWTVAHELNFPYGGAHPYDWVLTSDLPYDRPGTAWFCENPTFGDNCQTINESGVHYLYSPPMTFPEHFDRPILAFTHYMASEPDYDGGNLKISVNGGSWQLVPEAAIIYNWYNDTIKKLPNDNPLQDERAWSGFGGRWGTSLADLRIFVTGGDTVRFRFDFGKDGCNGVDGWYLDDLRLYVCSCTDNPGTVEDCNSNDIPDDCEADCNDNGVADDCDVADGTSVDCNANSIPDECEADCNTNGIADECDITNGTSSDCTGNNIPDECEPDCNATGVADVCEIADGTSIDCNANEIPDECDVASGTSGDCDTDDVPDECQPDCDGDGIPDACMLPPLGDSNDCDSNGVPDECQPDCNGNGVADSCDIATGGSQDCDSGGVPDECEPDSDDDGVIDACDACANDPHKTDPGECGCGVPDTDGDGDGALDCVDECPNDSNKVEQGECGCGVADTDSDGDGIANCVDGCPEDAGKSAPGSCGCGNPDTDTDGDGAPDCIDDCPLDPNETEAGVCGCGVRERDSDRDGTPDCIDGCPTNPRKIEPGVCGCLTPETDSDRDNTPDCRDACPFDEAKTDPGQCGCGVVDVDLDRDGTADCVDGCPGDSTKTEPGACGCGVPETDADGDGITDCVQDDAGDFPGGPPAAVTIHGPTVIVAGDSGTFAALLVYSDGSSEDVTHEVRWEVYAGDSTVEDAVQTGVATMADDGLLRIRQDFGHNVTLLVVAYYQTDTMQLVGHHLVTAAAPEPSPEQSVNEPESDSTRRFCGTGAFGTLLLVLSLLTFVRLSRRT